MSGLLAPEARLREFSDLGLVLPGGKLHTYVAGTPSTNLATYSDAALTIPNANPIVASAGGLFGPVYLSLGVSYKFVLTDASDVVVWTQDNIAVPAASPTLPLASMGVNDFRLTLTSGVPLTTADVLAATVIYASPMGGNRIDLYDAAGVPTTYTSAQFQIALPAVASQVYDVFVYNNAGVPTLELLAWTNDTTRATALVLTTTGCYTKSGDLTRRYLASVRTTTVAGQTEDSVVKRLLWNYYHRAPRLLTRVEPTVSWSYATATVRQANASAANQVEVLVGVAEAPVVLTLLTGLIVTGDGGAGVGHLATVGIGEDSTTTISASSIGGVSYTFGNGAGSSALVAGAHFVKIPAVGRHVYSWNERGDGSAGTWTWYGTPAMAGGLAGTANGLSGWVAG